jgi:hypothetical protein
MNLASLADFYRAQGYFLPVRAAPEEEALALADWLGALPRDRLDALGMPWVQKSYLLFPALDRLMRSHDILDAVATLYGPDLIVISADLFIKPPQVGKRISWHQDVNYWGLEPMEVVTAWIALTEATAENGCMRYSPGGHLHERLPHTETYAADNMLSRGQEIAVEVDEKAAVMVALRPGEASLHHGFLPHASGPNRTDRPRIGFAIRYAPTRVRQTAGPPMSVMPVRGEDRFGHFPHEPRPEADLDPAAIAAHRAALAPHAVERFSTI